MENRMVIEVAGNEINVVSDQPPEVICKTADAVADRMLQMMGGNKMTSVVAAILTAMNMMEELEKEEAASDQLRRELSSYAQENAEYKKKMENLEEIQKQLKKELENLKVDYQIRETAVKALEEKDEELSRTCRELENLREGHQRFRQETQGKQESLKKELENLRLLLTAKEQEKQTLIQEKEQLKSDIALKQAEADETAALKSQLQEWKNKWESAGRELAAYRQREAAAGALGEELNAVRKSFEENRLKYEETVAELELLRQKNEVREEEYQRERDELQSELSQYKMMYEELAEEAEESYEDGESKAELLEYKAKYEALTEEFEAFKINYALKSNELERLKKQMRR